MRTHTIPTLALILALVAVPGADLHGQERVVPFAGAGLALGTGELGDDTGTGWTVFGGLDLPLGVPGLSVGATAGYARIPYDGAFDEVTNVTSLLGELEYVIGAASPGMVLPYVRGGAGIHVHRYDPGSIAANATTLSRPGVSLGVGVKAPLGAVTAFLGGRFVTDLDRGFIGFHGGLSLP